jgi:formate dehydrogenase iron-sulfur subunit
MSTRTEAWPDTYDGDARPRMGFFTDTSVCIGCKACAVACKEWNLVPEDGLVWSGESFDNTSELGANSWRHVAFVEQTRPLLVNGDGADDGADDPLRWLMSSDVCKHCTESACLNVCPTGAIFRTELGTVVVQEDVCNGCGYCVPACPFGVLDRRRLSDPERDDRPDGRVWKCTLCYDRTRDGMTPACAQACPTESIQYGPLDELRQRAGDRLDKVVADGFDGARLYGESSDDGVGGFGAFFLLLDEPEVYGLPPAPRDSTRDLPGMWRSAAAAGAALVAGLGAAFLVGRRGAGT